MKNMKHFVPAFFYFLLSIIVLTSCNEESINVQPSTGKTNELLIVTNGEKVWNNSAGLAIKQHFGRFMTGLPQDENTFSMPHVPESNFSKMFKSHHNIFILDIDPSFKKPILETKKDLWASPQRVVKITAADEETFLKQFEDHKESIIELFNANERRRVQEAYASIEDYKITKKLVEKYQVEMLIPKGFIIATQTKEFVWLRREAQQYSQGIMMYFYPYTDTMAFNYDHILKIRDSITKKYIPGPSDGSYMKVSMVEPPTSKRIDFNGNFAVEMRGLWELENDFMGGPFISYTLVDTVANRVATLDAYVYNPNQEKKKLLRQVEALLYTCQFTDIKEGQDPKPE